MIIILSSPGYNINKNTIFWKIIALLKINQTLTINYWQTHGRKIQIPMLELFKKKIVLFIFVV